jgi:prepilin-type N-terminal cleavage/methylation domain-containing protein
VARVLLSSMKTRTRRWDDHGFTLIEILVVVAIIGVLAAIAIISLARARQSGNEASAIGAIRAVISGQAAYASSCGAGGYAQSNADLGRGPAGGAAFISPDLAKADVPATAKSGYTIDVDDSAEPGNADVLPAAETCNGSATPSRAMFHVAADPVSLGVTGTRSFGSDRRGTIYFDITTSVPNPIPAGLDFIQ